MCRLAAFPKNFDRDEAIHVLLDFEKNNTDGFGYSYIDESGQFVTKKWALSLSVLLKRGYPILNHMPYNNGWTIAHLRAASCGVVRRENSHPFEVNGKAGEFSVCHNGHFSDHKLLRLAMGCFVDFQGETDSEVSANLLAQIGPKKFSENFDSGGMYLALRKDGTLFAIRTSWQGDLRFKLMENKQVLIGSTLHPYGFNNTIEAVRGCYEFAKDGSLKSMHKKETHFNSVSALVSNSVLPHHYRHYSGNGRYMGEFAGD